MNSLIVGMGEVGTALAAVLKPFHNVYVKDLGPAPRKIPKRVDVMHVCLRHNESFPAIVQQYVRQYRPAILDICTTVPPGTTEQFPNACHSTTRGLHPNLEESLKTFVKHIGGPKAEELARYYRRAGIRTRTHKRSRTTELAHILSNTIYGVNLLLADELNRLCRHYGVDYTEAVMGYSKTSNEGYEELDHKSKFRMVLTPPNGKIGGHCVLQNVRLLPDSVQTPLIRLLAQHGD